MNVLVKQFREAHRIYRNHGLHRLLYAIVGYIGWVVEFGLFARVADRYVDWKDGLIERGELTFDVSGKMIQRETRYRILREMYEPEELHLVKEYLDPEYSVVEFGGGIGFISCHINNQLAAGRSHIVVEANPNLVGTLKRNRSLNDCSFEILHAAYAPGRDTITFDIPSHFESGRVAADQSMDGISIEATSLDVITDTYHLNQYAIVADIEGSERHLIEADLDSLVKHCQLLIVESHFDSEEQSRFLDTLENHGFQHLETRGDVVVLKRG